MLASSHSRPKRFQVPRKPSIYTKIHEPHSYNKSPRWRFTLRKRRLLNSWVNVCGLILLTFLLGLYLSRDRHHSLIDSWQHASKRHGQKKRAPLGDPYQDMDAIEEELPEFVDIPFEEAVKDEYLLGWEDDWVAYGKLPYVEPGTSLQKPKFDVVVTWVNGSQQAFRDLREQYAAKSPLNVPGTSWLRDSASRHREWAQIQWAIMSSIQYVEDLGMVRVITSHDQTPEFPDLNESEISHVQRHLKIISDHSLFSERHRECTMPTFNSVAIEVNMGSLESPHDKFLYICDDMLLTKRFTAGDIYTPLFGISMSIYDGLVWNADNYPEFDPTKPFQGEYPEYHYSSWHFNRAFGKRNRAYIRHATKVYSRSLLREVAAAFPKAYFHSSRSKFRGDSNVINPHFHAYHYVIERHRKALLWSFFVLRSDQDSDGRFSRLERRDMLAVLAEADDYISNRQTMRTMSRDLQDYGLSPANALRPRWSSFDGPAYSWFAETKIKANPIYHKTREEVQDKPDLDFECTLDMELCFGAEFLDTQSSATRIYSRDLLERFNTKLPACGDCIINKLIHASGQKGLSAFLPAEQFSEKRDLALKAILRYSYTKNKLPGTMMQLGASDYDLDLLKYRLDVFRGGFESMPSEICVNDDVPAETSNDRIAEIRVTLNQFYRSMSSGRKESRGNMVIPVMPRLEDYNYPAGNPGEK